MKSSRRVVIDIGTAHVAVAEFAPAGPEKLVLREFALETHSADPALDAGWAGRTAQALAAVAMASGTGGAAKIAIPGHLALTKVIKTHSVAPAKRGKIIEFEASQAIPYPLAEVVWEQTVLADDGRDLEIMVTAAKIDAVERICTVVHSAGYRITGVLTPAQVLDGAFRWNYPGMNEPVLVADIGARTTTLVIIGPDGFRGRTLPSGGNTVTAAIAADFQLDFAQTELIKLRALSADRAEGQPSPSAVQRVVGNFLAQLQLEIARTMANHRRQDGAKPPVAIYLTGGGSRMAGLAEALAEKFQLRVERYDPLRNVELSPGARDSGAAASSHALTTLVGLARTAMTHEEAGIGLLPPKIREEEILRHRRPRWLGAAALLALALLPPAWHYHRLTQLTEAQATEVDAQLQPLQLRARRNAAQLKEIAATQRKIAVIRRLVEAKSTWAAFLADLQQRLGGIEDVWLDQMSLAPSPAMKPAVSGAAGSPLPELQLTLSGRLLDARNPVSKISPESYERARQLLARIAGSPFVAAIRNERFDNSQPGLLRFDFTLVLDPRHPL